MKLFEHQKRVIKHIINEDKKRYIVSMDMGMGKTLTLLGLIKILKTKSKQIKRVLIIAPKNVIPDSWCYDDKLVGLEVERICNSDHISKIPKGGIFAVGYSFFNYHAEKFKQYKYDIVICDESHWLGNRASKRTKNIIGYYRYGKLHGGLNTDRIYLLTGTFMPNSEQQAYPQLVACGLKASWTKFKQAFFWENPKIFGHVVFLDELRPKFNKLLERYMIHVDKSEVKRPEYAINMLTIDYNIPDNYRGVYDELIREDFVENNEFKCTIDYPITKASRLREIAKGYIKDDSGVYVELFKKPYTMLNTFLKNKPYKFVVFYSRNMTLDMMEKHSFTKGMKWKPYNGQMSNKEKEATLDWFHETDDAILVCNWASGRVGLNLHRSGCHNMILFELDYNNEFYEQAKGRIDRIGQTKDVNYYTFKCRDSIDDVILDALERKQNMLDSIKNYLMKGGK